MYKVNSIELWFWAFLLLIIAWKNILNFINAFHVHCNHIVERDGMTPCFCIRGPQILIRLLCSEVKALVGRDLDPLKLSTLNCRIILQDSEPAIWRSGNPDHLSWIRTAFNLDPESRVFFWLPGSKSQFLQKRKEEFKILVIAANLNLG